MLSMIPMMQPHILKTEPLAALVGIFQQLMLEKNWKRRAWVPLVYTMCPLTFIWQEAGTMEI